VTRAPRGAIGPPQTTTAGTLDAGAHVTPPSTAPGPMTKRTRRHVDDLRGAGKLAIEATKGVTAVVEAMHRTIASGPGVLGKPLALPARAMTGVVYGSIRGVTGLVGAGLDRALEKLGPLLGESVPGPEREAVVSALNGVLGDYLRDTANPLAITMQLRAGGATLAIDRDALGAAFPDAAAERARKILLLVHGSSMNDLQWSRHGHDHGAALARDLGYAAIYLHYNTGLHVSTNGRALADLLERLAAAWPAEVDEIAIVGHSMGGLVARSACHYAEEAGHAWRARLRNWVSLGTPHHGAPLERGGNWVDFLLTISPYSAPLAALGKIRSAGVTDLRFGAVLDEHWQARDRFARGSDPRGRLSLPSGVRSFAVAGTKGAAGTEELPGDGLVPVDSALGRHAKPELSLPFPDAHRRIAYETDHLALLERIEVYEAIRDWLTP